MANSEINTDQLKKEVKEVISIDNKQSEFLSQSSINYLQDLYTHIKVNENELEIIKNENEFIFPETIQKKINFINNIDKYKKEHPFMIDQILSLNKIDESEEEFIYKKNESEEYLGGVNEKGEKE